MNNELGRKITSLTLMTIMLAGGMTFAVPGMMPVAHAANATLFVSAENSMFDNYFFGTQIVEIVVSDPLIATLDDVHGSPDVEVNGNDVVMTQASDGSWYAYIADTQFAELADDAQIVADQGLNLGASCTAAGADFATLSTGADIGGQSGVVFFSGATFDDIGTAPSVTVAPATCADASDAEITSITSSLGIVKAAKTLNLDTTISSGTGQIGLIDKDLWPFIQTYDFNPTGSAVVDYNKAGVNETVTLVFDVTDGLATFDIDRTTVPLSAQVHFNVGDPMLNIDPTSSDEWEWTAAGAATYRSVGTVAIADLGFGLNGAFKTTLAPQTTVVLERQANLDTGAVDKTGIFETGANTAIFSSTDNADTSTIKVASTATRGLSGTLDYNDTPTSIVIGHEFGTIDMDALSVGDEWNSGEGMTVLLVDADQNLNSLADEDLDLNSSTVTLVPSLQIGSPKVLTTTVDGGATFSSGSFILGTPDSGVVVDSFSEIARATLNSATGTNDAAGAGITTGTTLVIDTGITVADLRTFVEASGVNFVYLNYDIRSLTSTTPTDLAIHAETSENAVFQSTTVTALSDADATQAKVLLKDAVSTATTDDIVATGTLNAQSVALSETENVRLTFTTTPAVADNDPFVIDFFSFGDRVNNAIYRLELEETGDNTGEFIGSVEYIMTNQLNQVAATYDGLVPILDAIVILVTEDLTDEDGPRTNYLDLGSDGVSTQIADQQDAPTHSGVVDLDLDTYKIADTVVVTLTDQDLNVSSTLVDIYVAQSSGKVDSATASTINHLLDITFNDVLYGLLGSTDGFVLVETEAASGVFTGSFQVPSTYDLDGPGGAATTGTTTGTDIEVNYNDHRDASGETIEVGDGAGIRANTGSISLDRTVYPVPWGVASDFATITSGKTTNSFSIFPIHATGIDTVIDTTGEQIKTTGGDVTIHVRVSDPDLDLSAAGQDKMNTNRSAGAVGPVTITVSRGTDELTLAYAGGSTVSTTKTIVVGSDSSFTARTMGPITETAGNTGVFELDFAIRYTDGPDSTLCPTTTTYENLDGGGTAAADRFGAAPTSGEDFCILQGDILTVEYTDAVDASGNTNTVTDSATFDLRNGVLQSDKSVYIIGSDMIITVIEPDWDLDNDGAETYDLDIIEWDSDAATTSMGDQAAGASTGLEFDPEPSALRETGDSTGIFQIVVEIPQSINGDNLERGEQIQLEYTDWGPSGARYVGQENEDMNVTVYTSNFGATVELDQKVYTWTDKVYITIVAPDHNFDSNLVDTIGETSDDPIKITTRSFDINKYSLVETGTDTGIFTGEVILTGFLHDSNGDGTATGPSQTTSADSTGPTNGFLETDNDDGLTVSFEFSEDETTVGSALIRWNIGEVQWLEASYPASGTGVVRAIDPDMNLNPEAVDNFKVDLWSDSDAGGIALTVTETNEATGIFEGTVFFTTTNESSGHRLRVAEGDTVTAEYEDNTLPDPYTRADELDVTATTLIGTIVPPLERAPAANLRTVDAFGNSLDTVSVDQQVQISADLANGQDREQPFAYLVQIQDGNGVTVSLAWITGSLSSGQSFSPALSWIPTTAGTYTATAFVWESVDNPTALSPPVSTTITVQ